MARSRHIKVKGVRKQLSPEDIELVSLALWLQAKRVLRERREREAKARAKRNGQKR